jgi:hypothetical protein
VTYIVNGALSEDQIKGVVARVKKTIEENGGALIDTNEWGNRRLTYLCHGLASLSSLCAKPSPGARRARVARRPCAPVF